MTEGGNTVTVDVKVAGLAVAPLKQEQAELSLTGDAEHASGEMSYFR
jgi:hypothetical protein